MNNTTVKAIGNFARRTWDISVSAAAHGLGITVGIGALAIAYTHGYDRGREYERKRGEYRRYAKADRVYEWDPHKDQDKDEE